MKKTLIITAFYILAHSAVFAQSITSGKFTIYIEDLKTRSYTQDWYGTKYNFEEYIGTYKIIKNGITIKNHNFNSRTINGVSMLLFLEDPLRKGYPLSYSYKTKKYEIAKEQFKPKKTNSIENIILSGILIHTKWFKD